MKKTSPLPPLFFDDYFSQRIRRGEKPKYGYPVSPPVVLPKNTPPMEVKTGFMAGRRAQKKSS
ncbi:hypothetical protein HYW58_01490 [Candidatus Kaiserbacteria bacterium]|nr:hypothetical protein [Candidatus Kaiserbacteria bacterium]